MTTASVLICQEAPLDGDLVATHHATLEEHWSRPVWKLHDLRPAEEDPAEPIRWIPPAPESFRDTLLAMVAVRVLETPAPDALREEFVDLDADSAPPVAADQLSALAAITLADESRYLLVTLIDSGHLAEQLEDLGDRHPRVATYRGTRPGGTGGGWGSA